MVHSVAIWYGFFTSWENFESNKYKWFISQ